MQKLIAEGRITAEGHNYVTEDGTVIYRVTKYGRKGHATEMWRRADDGIVYRSLSEAYWKISR